MTRICSCNVSRHFGYKYMEHIESNIFPPRAQQRQPTLTSGGTVGSVSRWRRRRGTASPGNKIRSRSNVNIITTYFTIDQPCHLKLFTTGESGAAEPRWMARQAVEQSGGVQVCHGLLLTITMSTNHHFFSQQDFGGCDQEHK